MLEISHVNKKKFYSPGQRTISQLNSAAQQLTEQNILKRKAEKQKAKIAELNTLAPKESKMWNDVIKHVTTKNSKGYDNAIHLLIQLKELAHHLGTVEQFTAKVKKIQLDFSRYHSFTSKMKDKKII